MTTLAPPEPYVTKQAVADYIGMSLSWIEKAQARGLPFHKFGSSVRFRLTEVEEWLTQCS